MRNGDGSVSVEGDRRWFLSLDELVEYFRSNRGRLMTRLRRALSQATVPMTEMMTRYSEMYEIDRADVALGSEILSCPPSDVGGCHRIYIGTYKQLTNVRDQSINQSIIDQSISWAMVVCRSRNGKLQRQPADEIRGKMVVQRAIVQ